MTLIKAVLASVVLSVSSFANAGLILNEDFDPITAANWTILGGTTLGNPSSEFFSQNALHFNGTGTRSAATVGFDLSTGGMLSFVLKIGGPNDTATFENADSGEDVVLQYSNNNGAWTDIITFDTEDLNYRDTWGAVNIDLASLILGSNTQFQWSQVQHSGTSFDNWAIDNVRLTNNVEVPEPTSVAILGLGLLGLASRRLKKK